MTPPNRIRSAFARAGAEDRPALAPYLMAGHPDRATVVANARALADGGADVIEIGMPFSDPLADGPTIQRVADASLAAGTTTAECIATAAAVREAVGPDVALVLMGYVNPLLRYGYARFAADAAAAGVDGVIVADLPLEESAPLIAELRRCGLSFVPLVAPTTPDERIARLVADADGFVYCVAVAGLTGARASLSADVAPLVARIRAATELPVAVGFGISTAEHVAAVAACADGAVVASALLDRLDPLAAAEQPAAAADFLHSLRGTAVPV